LIEGGAVSKKSGLPCGVNGGAFGVQYGFHPIHSCIRRLLQILFGSLSFVTEMAGKRINSFQGRERGRLIQAVIIILTKDQRETTLQCLTALQDTGQGSYPILVWDNGSQDDTAVAVQQTFPHVLVHQHPTNLGVASGRNAAARLALETFPSTHLLFLDNDILVEPGFVKALYQPFTENAQVGQTQAKLRFMDDRERLNDAGGARINFLLWQITPVGYREMDRGQYDVVTRCISCGGAMMVRADVFQELGGFDSLFDPFGPEDMDFSLRLQKAGYLALYVPQAIGYHAVSHTFGKGYTEAYARHKSRHWFKFMRRHASPFQQLAFFLIGAPYLTLRALWRQGRRGNLGAVRGLLRGILDLARSSRRPEKGRS
jgi:GT2 family glycosyltransferase